MNCKRRFIDGKHCKNQAQKDTYWMTFPVCHECHAQLKYRFKNIPFEPLEIEDKLTEEEIQEKREVQHLGEEFE